MYSYAIHLLNSIVGYYPCRAGQQFAAVKDPNLHLVVKITRHAYRLVKLESWYYGPLTQMDCVRKWCEVEGMHFTSCHSEECDFLLARGRGSSQHSRFHFTANRLRTQTHSPPLWITLHLGFAACLESTRTFGNVYQATPQHQS